METDARVGRGGSASRAWSSRLAGYEERLGAASRWLDEHLGVVGQFFSSALVRDFVFGPFRGLFDFTGTPTEIEVRQTITTVALMNAAMAAIPGSIGPGLVVAIALESYMAFRIARLLGFNVRSPGELMRSVGAGAVTAFGTGVVFSEIFGTMWRTLAFLPGPGTVTTFFAEFATTTLLGILFWVTFEALQRSGEPLAGNESLSDRFTEHVHRAIDIARETLGHQFKLMWRLLRPNTIRSVGVRAWAFLKGDIVFDPAELRGDVFVPAAMAWLLARESERLDGPMGQLFLDSVRRAMPELAAATPNQMADALGAYSGEHLQGMMNLIKGEMFEHMVAYAENVDGDTVKAQLHADRNVPATDVVFTDAEHHRQFIYSLKATMDPSYIEGALHHYPDVPIMSTDEVAHMMEHSGMVIPSGISHAELLKVTHENYDELLWKLPSHEALIGGGITLSAFVSLYPFAVAWSRGRIDRDRFMKAVKRVTGQSGMAIASRIAFAAALGPVFGWYLLARGAGMLSERAAGAVETADAMRRYRVEMPERRANTP